MPAAREALWEIGGSTVGTVGRRRKQEVKASRSYSVRSDIGRIPTGRPEEGEQAVIVRPESNVLSSESVHTVPYSREPMLGEWCLGLISEPSGVLPETAEEIRHL
jgi:hypothetical protein